MVRGCWRDSRHGSRGIVVMPTVAPMLEGSNPQGEEQVLNMSRFPHDMRWVWQGPSREMSEALNNHLCWDKARAPVPLRVHHAPQLVLVAFTKNSRWLISWAHKCHRQLNHLGMTSIQVMCFALCNFDLHHEGPHRRSSAKGELSSIEKYAPTSAKHGRQIHVRRMVRGTVTGEVIF